MCELEGLHCPLQLKDLNENKLWLKQAEKKSLSQERKEECAGGDCPHRSVLQ